MRSALYWDITRRRVVIVYRRFETTYRYHLQGSRADTDWEGSRGVGGISQRDDSQQD
jgi:hypothetical protein